MGEEPLSAVEYPLVEYGRQDSFLFVGADVFHDGVGGRDCWEVSYRNFGGTVIVATADIGIGGLQADGMILTCVSFKIAVQNFSVFSDTADETASVFSFTEITVGDCAVDDFSTLVISCEGVSLWNFIF